MVMYYSEGGWGAWDIHESYSRVANSIMGIIQVICGLASMALGVGAICTWATYWRVAYGIWCGFVFTWAGGIGIGAARHKNTCLIMTTLLLSIFSIILACVQFGLGVAAATYDSPSRRNNIVAGKFADNYHYYDIYYRRNHPYTYICGGEDYGFTFSSAWGPVDILLLSVAFIELIAAIIETVFCSIALCGRSSKEPRGLYYPDHTGTGTTDDVRDVPIVSDQKTHLTNHSCRNNNGFSNEAFLTDSRMSPPLYKVTM